MNETPFGAAVPSSEDLPPLASEPAPDSAAPTPMSVDSCASVSISGDGVGGGAPPTDALVFASFGGEVCGTEIGRAGK